jgi:hypothetical protein
VLSVAAPPARAEDLPLPGLAHVELRVTDSEQSRKFDHDLLGFEKPFEAIGTESARGAVAFYKVNDRQFIELVSGLKADVAPAMTHIAMATDNVDRFRPGWHARRTHAAQSQLPELSKTVTRD